MRLNYLLLLLLLIGVACTNDEQDPLLEQSVSATQSNATGLAPAYEPGHVRILVTQDLSEQLESVVSSYSRPRMLASDEKVSQINVRSMQRTFPYAGRFEERTRKEGLHLWYDVEFDVDTPLEKAKHNLSGIRGIKVVELRPVMTLTSYDDPRLAEQWHYQNAVGNAHINLFGAWSYTSGTPDVIVAIVDGGIDYTHEDLASNMWVNTAEKNGTPGVDDDKNGYKDDVHGFNFVASVGKLVPHNHGTHVAGTVAAVNNNGIGVCGVAGGNGSSNSGVRLMSCQIFVDEGDPYASNSGGKGSIAIKYAADNGAVICQNSWGYETLTQIPASDKAAIDYFIKYAGVDENGVQTGPMRGGLVVFAAGNEDRSAAAPAIYEPVIAVSSIGKDFRKATYSNYGEWVDLAAPGNSILSTLVGGYGYLQGTSMACPHVSGVAALVLSKFKRAGYNPDMLRARLESSATNIDGYNAGYKGKLGKLLQAQAAMAGGSTQPPASVGAISARVQSNTVTLQIPVPSDPDDGKASGFNVYASKSSLNTLNPNQPASDVIIRSFSTGHLNVGEELEATMNGLDFESTYYFRVNAFDFSGNFSGLSAQLVQTTMTNHAPVLVVSDSVDVIMKAFESVVLRFEGNDPDGHALFWSLQAETPGVTLVDMGDNNAQVTIKGPESSAGIHTVQLQLEDEYGAKDTKSISFEVRENNAPMIVEAFENLYLGSIGQQQSVSISRYFSDLDGEPLKYRFANTAPNVINVNENQGVVYFVSLAYGLARITVSATDALGQSVQQSFSVLVRDDNQPIDVYPNPVKDVMWLRTGTQRSCSVSIVSNAGAVVLEKDVDVSPFNPASFDVSALSGGVYSVVVKYDNKVIKKPIIKL
jgi:subtilisin family serine protease